MSFKSFAQKPSIDDLRILPHTNLEVFDAVVLYYLRLRGKISAGEYYRKLGYALNPYRKIFHDLQDLGYKAINLVWDELGPEFAASFIPLLVEPGILTRTKFFVEYAKQIIHRTGIRDPLEIRNLYAQHLGEITIFRVLMLTKQEEAVRKAENGLTTIDDAQLKRLMVPIDHIERFRNEQLMPNKELLDELIADKLPEKKTRCGSSGHSESKISTKFDELVATDDAISAMIKLGRSKLSKPDSPEFHTPVLCDILQTHRPEKFTRQWTGERHFMCVTQIKKIAYLFAVDCANWAKKHPGSTPFLFEIKIPRIYLVEWNKEYLPFNLEPNPDSRYFKCPRLLIDERILGNNIEYRTDDPKVESFVEGLIGNGCGQISKVTMLKYGEDIGQPSVTESTVVYQANNSIDSQHSE